ncbi:MAG: hypothetical protein PVH88_24670 [Ignavibacteria bacterium]|jgi:hypothetical protein
MAKSIITVVFLFLLFNSNAAAQQETVKFPARQLLRIVNKAETHVMFNTKDGKLYILDQDRNALYPSSYEAPDEEVFYVYTVDYVVNYVNQAGTKIITFTKDESGVVRLGDGGGEMKTMDLIPECPPQCY